LEGSRRAPNRAAFMDHALTFLGLVKGELFTSNPDNQF
jgi:hypothetical protein